MLIEAFLGWTDRELEILCAAAGGNVSIARRNLAARELTFRRYLKAGACAG